MIWQLEPLTGGWPWALTEDPEPSPFRAGWKSTLDLLDRDGPLTYPCDTYDHWQANVRAIALSLEALRKVDRYGVGGHGEQYAGWKAIESGRTSHFATADEALRWLRQFTRLTTAPKTAWRELLRVASREAHPDVGGDPADWDRVDAARQLLERSRVVG